MPTDTIADIKVTETIKEGKTIFRRDPGARAAAPAADMTPLFTAATAGADNGDAHDAVFLLTAPLSGETPTTTPAGGIRP